MTPFFSVIIPVYNVAPYLRECLDSVYEAASELNRNCGGMGSIDEVGVEIVCVDDGSVDGSGDILDAYYTSADKGSVEMKVLHQSNHGASAARNVALSVVCGEWISFVDADDYVLKDYFLKFYKNPLKSDLNFFSCQHEYVDGMVLSSHLKHSSNVVDRSGFAKLASLLMWNRANTPFFGYTVNKFFRRKIIDSNTLRFNEDLRMCEDEIFTLQYLSVANTCQVSSDVLYVYRCTEHGLSYSRNPPWFAAANQYLSLSNLNQFSSDELMRRVIIKRALACGLSGYKYDSRLSSMLKYVNIMRVACNYGSNRFSSILSRMHYIPDIIISVFCYFLAKARYMPSINVIIQ